VAAGAREDQPIEQWRPVAAGGSWLGPPEAEVVIVEFGDYECPFCRNAESYLRSLREEYPDRVAISYRHFPLTNMHQFAMRAAIMAECARIQGRFASVHKLLYDRELSRLTVETVSEQVSDPQAFLRCVEGNEVSHRIADDMEQVETLGLTGTPSFIVDGTLLGSPPDSAGMFALVASALEGG